MRRLNGIGVSPGVVSGRAVILIQRAQVLRYQIAETRLGLLQFQRDDAPVGQSLDWYGELKFCGRRNPNK